MACIKRVRHDCHNSFRVVLVKMQVRTKVLILLVAFTAYSWCDVSSPFRYGIDFSVPSFGDAGKISKDLPKNENLRVAKRYYKEFSMNISDSIRFKRVKRDDSTFVGHPKTREERWHASFNINQTNLQQDQAQSLVNLLIKVMDRYLNSCIPIIFYDRQLESEGIILQTFFKAIKISYLHGIITDNYTVVNQDLLNPYDKNCRSYYLFLTDVLRTRDVLGPQTSNRVVLIPRSTQWKLQEFLSSKQASDIVNLLVIGESMTADATKVL